MKMNTNLNLANRIYIILILTPCFFTMIFIKEFVHGSIFVENIQHYNERNRYMVL